MRQIVDFKQGFIPKACQFAIKIRPFLAKRGSGQRSGLSAEKYHGINSDHPAQAAWSSD
jgi:hypothetical protein